MELEEFIETTLNQIMKGVSRAQLGDHDGKVAPRVEMKSDKDVLNAYGDPAYWVNFDVAVSANDSIGHKAGAKISVLGINMGTEVTGDRSDNKLSRIQFKIPIVYPSLRNAKALAEKKNAENL